MSSMSKSKYEEIAHRMRDIPPDLPATSYEWEELVQRLCDSEDSGLHEIGVRELELLRRKCPHCPFLISH